MNNCQRGILAPVPKLARYLSFSLKAGSNPRRALGALVELVDGAAAVMGMGQSLVRGQGAGLDGSSFVAVQQWVHDFQRFDAMSPKEQDNSVGRRRSDNKELSGAPRSAHVKRTAQESFAPQAFILRRSMPWSDDSGGGLNFVAFGKSFDAFEAQLKRMVGAEDGVTDALFKFTRPVTGSYFWCPPMAKGHLDLRALGL